MNRTICILTTVHEPFDHRVFFKEALSLQQAGYRVVLITPHKRAEIVRGIEIIALPPPRNRLSRMLFTSAHLLREALRQRADAYHFHDPELIPAALVLKLLRHRIVYDVHEDVPRDIMIKYYIPAAMRRVVARIVEWTEQTAARFFDGVVVTTEDIRKNFAWHPGVTLVRNLPLLAAYDGERPRRPGQPFTLVYAGSLVSVRGITQVVRAMERLPQSANVRLLLCGVWEPAEYEGQVRSLTGFTRTEYLGNLSFDSIPGVLARADAGLVCLQPTQTYPTALPTKMFEYMASGLPVIASNFPLWQEIVGDSGAGICVDPTDSDSIAEAILRLYEDPALAQQMGKQGRRIAQEQWSWESEERALLGLYRDLLVPA